MNICFVAGVFPPHVYGGAENYILRIAHYLEQRGHNITILTTKPYESFHSLYPTKEKYEGLEVWRFYPINFVHGSTFPDLKFSLKSLWKNIDIVNPHAAAVLGAVLKQNDFDIIHTHNLVGISTLCARVIQRDNAKHIHTLHDCNLICPGGNPRSPCGQYPPGKGQSIKNDPQLCRIFSRVQRTLFGHPDLVLAPSDDVIDTHRRYGFFKDIPSQRLQFGVSNIATSPGEPQSDPAVLFTGRVTRMKGIHTLIESAKLLPSIDFHICGTGELKETVRQYDEKQENIIYHGFISEEKLQILRRRSHLGVVPSTRRENSPMVIYEAFAQGLPVVGSDFGGIPELIQPGKNGGLVEPGNVDDLVNMITSLIQNPKYLDLRKNALAFAQEHTLDNHVLTLENEYKKALQV